MEQAAFAWQLASIRNIVFMGMGEPLDNYSAVSVRSLGPSAAHFAHVPAHERLLCGRGFALKALPSPCSLLAVLQPMFRVLRLTKGGIVRKPAAR